MRNPHPDDSKAALARVELLIMTLPESSASCPAFLSPKNSATHQHLPRNVVIRSSLGARRSEVSDVLVDDHDGRLRQSLRRRYLLTLEYCNLNVDMIRGSSCHNVRLWRYKIDTILTWLASVIRHAHPTNTLFQFTIGSAMCISMPIRSVSFSVSTIGFFNCPDDLPLFLFVRS